MALTACTEKEKEGANAGDQHSMAEADSPSEVNSGVNGARIIAADLEPGNWLSHGRSYDEQRFSPLENINTTNVDQLGLAWSFDYGIGTEVKATPIVVDGVIFTTGQLNTVYALDAKSGREIWRWDPQLDGQRVRYSCCGFSSRGVAVWQNKVYVGLLDGRLVALDAVSGDTIWDVQTTDSTQAYTITGAPRVVNGKVIIGNGGAEFGVRGYVSAYDAESGEIVWRFHTVPGDPALGFESAAMAMAAKTWTGQWWKYGGGGTAYDAFAFDPKLNLLYIGTGNGSPWPRDIRSPDGGDNLFLASIVAVDANTGEYRWHYQTAPGESWDYTATQHMILADLEIDGAVRKVLMQAPKNGFFYVLDRETGELISAENYVPANWSTGVDPKTGKHLVPEQNYYAEAAVTIRPGPIGGHNWQSMSYSPLTGLVYIPAIESFQTYSRVQAFEHTAGIFNVGLGWSSAGGDAGFPLGGHLTAWDPVAKREAWRVQHKGLWNGGVLVTAGNLLVQGNQEGRLVIYQADSGAELWQRPVHTGVIAAPVSYLVDGEQYFAINAGWGGTWPLVLGEKPLMDGPIAGARLLAYKIGGKATLPEPLAPSLPPSPPPLLASNETVQRGAALYNKTCNHCHGLGAISGGSITDLRHLAPEIHERFNDIVLNGLLASAGMSGFADVLSEEDAEAIHAYLISRAHEDRKGTP